MNNSFTAYTLTGNAVNGSVLKSPDQATYLPNTVVTLTAIPDPGWHFTEWSGDLTGPTNSAQLTMTGNKTVTAHFARNPTGTYNLTVSAPNGSVTHSPSQAFYTAGSVVTLTATPAASYHFTGWSGDLSGATNPAPVTMTADKNITANFALDAYTLKISAAHGSVTQSPNQTAYNHGSVVTLTAVPAAGYHFTGWSGDLTGATSPGQITMTSDKIVTATFTPIPYTLTVTAVHGTVTQSPNEPTYDSGTAVTLTAVPATDYHFTGWSGDLTGTANPAQLTMSGNKSVTANFALNTYVLAVNAIHGSVAKSPNQAVYNAGSVVTLTAVPATGYFFAGWSGGASGTTNPIQLTMTGNTSVTASFTDHLGPTPANLGTVSNFTILASFSIHNTGPTLVDGNLGTTATSVFNPVAGFAPTGPGTVTGTIHIGNATASQAMVAFAAAYDDLAARPNAATLPYELGGLTLAPGLYKNGVTFITTGDLTLDAQGDPTAVWIFQIPDGYLQVGNSRKVILTGGAQANNIYWVAGTTASLGTSSIVAGNIMSYTDISLGNGATLTGRALARYGSVYLNTNTVTTP